MVFVWLWHVLKLGEVRKAGVPLLLGGEAILFRRVLAPLKLVASLVRLFEVYYNLKVVDRLR